MSKTKTKVREKTKTKQNNGNSENGLLDGTFDREFEFDAKCVWHSILEHNKNAIVVSQQAHLTFTLNPIPQHYSSTLSSLCIIYCTLAHLLSFLYHFSVKCQASNWVYWFACDVCCFWGVYTVKIPLFLEPSGPCAGCASAVEVDQEIVSFALAELSYGECEVNSIRVENFKQQVGSVSVVVVCY